MLINLHLQKTLPPSSLQAGFVFLYLRCRLPKCFFFVFAKQTNKQTLIDMCGGGSLTIDKLDGITNATQDLFYPIFHHCFF